MHTPLASISKIGDISYYMYIHLISFTEKLLICIITQKIISTNRSVILIA